MQNRVSRVSKLTYRGPPGVISRHTNCREEGDVLTLPRHRKL